MHEGDLFFCMKNFCIWLNILKADKYLDLKNPANASKMLKEAGRLEGPVEPIVRSMIHKTYSRYYKECGRSDDYYASFLMFLSYTPVESIPESARSLMAFEVAVAALIAPNCFNFGELMNQPLVGCLKNSTYEWIGALLTAMREGNFTKWSKALQEHKNKILSVPELNNNLNNLLKQKITLMVLVEAAFQMATTNRKMSMDEIAQICQLPKNEVELMVMKAMNVSLIAGSIDQVDETVTITWVKPRTLDKQSLGKMKERVESWSKTAKEMLTQLEELTPELLVS
eukprot:GHVL01033785.1.p1 GENE.GHVL01033785.1~~GHVL01033785.1.p1  ORF type:complete len:284 (+),score=37.44 GHVL01033785.1:1077-1928(+)